MERSIDLLERALTRTTQTELGKHIGVRQTAISNSRRIGHLSPLLAGQIAVFLSEPVSKWMTIAGIESAKKGKARTMLERHLQAAKTVEF